MHCLLYVCYTFANIEVERVECNNVRAYTSNQLKKFQEQTISNTGTLCYQQHDD